MPYKDPEAAREYQREYYASKRKYKIGKQWEYNLKRKYGMTLAEYDEMSEEQGHVCAICGSDDPGPNNGRFPVDHNHDTGAVRGLLCHFCNVGLGHFKDDHALLLKAADYLRQHNGPN